MSCLVRVQRKGQVTLPSRLRAAIGVRDGERLEASVQRGKIVLSPTILIDRSKFPNADSDYIPSQRRVIDARIAAAQKGPYHGPFNTAKDAIQFLRKEIKGRKSSKLKKFENGKVRFDRELGP